MIFLIRRWPEGFQQRLIRSLSHCAMATGHTYDYTRGGAPGDPSAPAWWTQPAAVDLTTALPEGGMKLPTASGGQLVHHGQVRYDLPPMPAEMLQHAHLARPGARPIYAAVAMQGAAEDPSLQPAWMRRAALLPQPSAGAARFRGPAVRSHGVAYAPCAAPGAAPPANAETIVSAATQLEGQSQQSQPLMHAPAELAETQMYPESAFDGRDGHGNGLEFGLGLGSIPVPETQPMSMPPFCSGGADASSCVESERDNIPSTQPMDHVEENMVPPAHLDFQHLEGKLEDIVTQDLPMTPPPKSAAALDMTPEKRNAPPADKELEKCKEHGFHVPAQSVIGQRFVRFLENNPEAKTRYMALSGHRAKDSRMRRSHQNL